MFNFLHNKIHTTNQVTMEIIKAEDTRTSLWSGGKTTELYIYPKDSEYIKRNFDIRISSAQVNLAESTFTQLPGVQRKLMILDGSLEIIHKNRYQKTLNKFDSDNFSGDWNTTSKGLVTDFNVMTTQNYNSNLNAIELKTNEILSQQVDNKFFLHIIYLLKGELLINTHNSKQIINKGDLIVFNNYTTFCNHTIKAKSHSEVIVSTIDKITT